MSTPISDSGTVNATPIKPAAAQPVAGRGALTFIYAFVILDVLSFGIIIPVWPRLLQDFTGGDTAHAAELLGWFSATWAMMQFLFSPVVGLISDRYGRRKVLLISCFGLCLSMAITATTTSLTWLFVGRMISGMTMAGMAAASAYVADVTPPEKRGAAMGSIGAAWGVGFILGPALGGLLGEWGLRLPFWAGAAMCFLNGMYGLFVVPESLAPEKRTRFFNWRRANPVGSLVLLRSHPDLLGLASSSLLFNMAQFVFPSTLVLYTSYRYDWSLSTLGLVFASAGLCNALSQGLLVRPVIARLGEWRTLMTGLMIGAVGLTLYGLAPVGWMFWMALPITGLVSIYGPSIQALMSRRVEAWEQGQLAGANASIAGITGLIAPLMFTQVFAYFIDDARGFKIPGAAFFLAALIWLSAAFVGWRTMLRAQDSNK